MQITDRHGFANSELRESVMDRWGAPIDQPWFLSDLEMRDDPRFHQQYELQEIQLAFEDRTGGEELTWTFRFTYYRRRMPAES